jgi:quercetin 2,3-dioxygenase
MRTSSIARPAVSIRPGADRHQTRIDWLHGRHSFDTGIDPLGADTHHGVLVVSNHDTIAPRSGFETHPHRNMEIVTWVLNGSLVHQDSEGHAGVIYPNLAQRMTAGTGIRHSEKNDRPAVNPDADRPLDLIQMWVVPDEPEVAPGYEQLELDPSDLQGHLAVVASGMTQHRDRAAIRIRNRYAALHVARLDPGESVTIPRAPRRPGPPGRNGTPPGAPRSSPHPDPDPVPGLSPGGRAGRRACGPSGAPARTAAAPAAPPSPRSAP